MRIYDIKIGIQNGEKKTFWKTIGSVFCDDGSLIMGSNGKPATFVIDYPEARGIVVQRDEKKNDTAN